MNYDVLRIAMEEQLSTDLYNLFNGELIEKIIREARIEQEHDEIKTMLEGHSFKITDKLAPSIHTICREVQKALHFDEEIDYYISNSPHINCFAHPRLEDNQSHKIIINSALLERFDDDELRFVVGHEVGHLASKNAFLKKILLFVFPDLNRAPILFQNKISLWDKLSELTADRYGFLAIPNLAKCISAFIKLSSGMNTSRISFDAMTYLKEMETLLLYFKEHPYAVMTSHPINPVRIKCLQLFADSRLYAGLSSRTKSAGDEKLAAKIQELVEILMVRGTSDLDLHRAHFIATAGILMSGADKEMNLREVESIINVLAQFTIFPKDFFDHILSSGEVSQLFQQAVTNILQRNPGERYSMLEYLIGMALSDNQIYSAELDLVFHIGENVFGMTRKEVAQIIGAVIQKTFVPRIIA